MVKPIKGTKIKQSPKLPAEMRRQQMLDEAAKLFSKQGFDATSTEQIAGAAGLTKGAFYHHFKNKEEILVELMREIIRLHLDDLKEALKSQMSPAQILQVLDRTSTKRCAHALAHDYDFRAQTARVPGVLKMVEKAIKAGCTMVAENLDKRYGRTLKERYNVALMIFCLWDGLRGRLFLSPRLFKMEDIISTADRLIKRGKH